MLYRRDKKINPELRWNEHKRKIEKGIGCPALQDAVKKYGIDNFTFKILIICFDEDRFKYEIEYIKKYNSQVPNGYNLTPGGEGGGFYGKTHSNNSSKQISVSLKQRFIDNPELKNIISERQKIINSTDEYRKKISDSVKKSTNWLNLKKSSHGYAKVKVLQYDLNENLICLHESIIDAGKNTNINKKCISKCINGKVKTSGGFIWKKFIDD
jgi:group I intron endonuclease